MGMEKGPNKNNEKVVDQSISIFPFETDWYNSKGLDTFLCWPSFY